MLYANIKDISIATNTVTVGGQTACRKGEYFRKQRVQSALVDGSYWSYNYDSLGQVTSGRKYWADGTPVAG